MNGARQRVRRLFEREMRGVGYRKAGKTHEKPEENRVLFKKFGCAPKSPGTGSRGKRIGVMATTLVRSQRITSRRPYQRVRERTGYPSVPAPFGVDGKMKITTDTEPRSSYSVLLSDNFVGPRHSIPTIAPPARELDLCLWPHTWHIYEALEPFASIRSVLGIQTYI